MSYVCTLTCLALKSLPLDVLLTCGLGHLSETWSGKSFPQMECQSCTTLVSARCQQNIVPKLFGDIPAKLAVL
jgi:hypothetical protein